MDLRAAGAAIGERVVGGDGVGAGRGHVEAQDRAEQGRGVLAVAVRIVAGSAVAEPHPQVSVRPEGDLPAIVVRVRLDLLQEHALAGRVENRRAVTVLRPGDLRQDRVAVDRCSDEARPTRPSGGGHPSRPPRRRTDAAHDVERLARSRARVGRKDRPRCSLTSSHPPGAAAIRSGSRLPSATSRPMGGIAAVGVDAAAQRSRPA